MDKTVTNSLFSIRSDIYNAELPGGFIHYKASVSTSVTPSPENLQTGSLSALRIVGDRKARKIRNSIVIIREGGVI